MIGSFDELIRGLKNKPKKRIAIAAAEDHAVLMAIKNAVDMGVIEPVLIGSRKKISKICEEIKFDFKSYETIDQEDPAESSRIAVNYIRQKRADLLMKGFVSTAPLLKAVVDKENGIRKNGLLSHVALFESPYYPKLIGVTDAAMNIAPTMEEKINIIQNAVDVFKKLGCLNPKVAVVCPVETVNEKIESTVHAALLTTMCNRNQIKGCIIDGPLALDNAISLEAAEHKGIESDVAGDADILLTHDLNSGNILYKSLIFMGGAKSAAIITGATVPVVLTSRADSEENKLFSIALGASLA